MPLQINQQPDALSVAREFFALAKANDDPTFTTFKLQKLLYLAQTWSQHRREKDLFADKVKAWEDGPVVPSIFHLLKGYQRIPFTNVELSQPSSLSEPDRELVFGVWQLYSDMDGDELSSMSHEHEAWQRARDRAHVFNNSPAISEGDMREQAARISAEINKTFTAFVAGLMAAEKSEHG